MRASPVLGRSPRAWREGYSGEEGAASRKKAVPRPWHDGEGVFEAARAIAMAAVVPIVGPGMLAAPLARMNSTAVSPIRKGRRRGREWVTNGFPRLPLQPLEDA